jgi:hypothetical protein
MGQGGATRRQATVQLFASIGVQTAPLRSGVPSLEGKAGTHPVTLQLSTSSTVAPAQSGTVVASHAHAGAVPQLAPDPQGEAAAGRHAR